MNKTKIYHSYETAQKKNKIVPKMFANRKVVVFILSVSCVTILCLCLLITGNNGVSNNANHVTKFVGSRDTQGFSMDMPVYNTVEELVNRSDIIVIASFSKEPRDVLTYWERVNKPAIDLDVLREIYVTKYEMNIIEVIKGEVTEKTIVISQMGQFNSNDYETKLKLNTEYILFLVERNYEKEFVAARAKEYDDFFENDKILYQLSYVESSIFEIKDDGTLYSYADFGLAYSFDGKKLETLVEETARIINRDVLPPPTLISATTDTR